MTPPQTPDAKQPSPLVPARPLSPLRAPPSIQRLLAHPAALFSVVVTAVVLLGLLTMLVVLRLASDDASRTDQKQTTQPLPNPKPAVGLGPRGGPPLPDTDKVGEKPSIPDKKPAGGDAPPETWRVGDNVASLEEAVRRAQPGATIHVPAGEFRLRQLLIINKSLTIRGAGRDQTRLLSWEEGCALKFTGEAEWTLADLTVEHVGNRWANVVVVEGGFATIRNCLFTGGVWDEQNRRGGAGLWFTGNARGHVVNCLCRNNGLHGIDVQGQAQPLLEGNTCEGNKQDGIAYFDSAGGTARNNACRNNGKHGIDVEGQAQPVLEGNTCEGNKGSGIAYFERAGGTARNNTCQKNQSDGIGLGGEAKPVLELNSCIENKRHGVCYFSEGKASGTAVKNTCLQNEGHGIAVWGQAQPLLEGNTCEGNKECGIAYFDSAGGTARNNTCRNNQYNGIYVRKGARPQLGPNILGGNRRGDLNVE